MNKINVGDIVYYAQILKPLGVFNILEMRVRYVQEDWFSAVEKRDKTAKVFSKKLIGKEVFFDRDEALALVLAAEEKNK